MSAESLSSSPTIDRSQRVERLVHTMRKNLEGRVATLTFSNDQGNVVELRVLKEPLLAPNPEETSPHTLRIPRKPLLP